jgi:hypothetical protein
MRELDNNGVPLETAREGHQGHDVQWTTAGAPGTGEALYCFDCKKNLWSTIRVLSPWEVI